MTTAEAAAGAVAWTTARRALPPSKQTPPLRSRGFVAQMMELAREEIRWVRVRVRVRVRG